MEKNYRSLKYWVWNLIVCFGISLIMSIATPLVQGYVIDWVSVTELTIASTIFSTLFTTLLPINDIAIALARVLKGHPTSLTKDFMFAIILTLVMSIFCMILLKTTSMSDWLLLLKTFVPLVFVSVIAARLSKFVANKVVTAM